MYTTIDALTDYRTSMYSTLDVIRWRTGLDVTLATIRYQYRMELANWHGDVCWNMRDVWSIEDMESVVSEWQWLEFQECN